MAPLVPEIISSQFDLVVAFLVGIGFGFVLEQAGFSSTRKLVGLFYGYDFTVLKVFFTAGVTAMVGVLLLGHLGLLDLSRIFINPMFTYSAIVGGLIMGAGFIIGGFCPGTSLCAAAVGRLDAFAFIGGSLLGILAFTEGYPFIEELFVSGNLGNLTIPEAIGISPELFGLALTIVAISAFVGTSKIEDWMNGVQSNIPKATQQSYAMVAVIPIVIIVAVWITPNADERLQNSVQSHLAYAEEYVEVIDVDKLAFELMNNAHKYNVIDVREFGVAEVPTAIKIPYEEMHTQAWNHLFSQRYKVNIFVGDSKEQVLRAGVLANLLGDKNPMALSVSVDDFRAKVFKAENPGRDAPKMERDRYAFYQQASEKLLKIEERLKNMSAPVKKETTRVKGGCT